MGTQNCLAAEPPQLGQSAHLAFGLKTGLLIFPSCLRLADLLGFNPIRSAPEAQPDMPAELRGYSRGTLVPTPHPGSSTCRDLEHLLCSGLSLCVAGGAGDSEVLALHLCVHSHAVFGNSTLAEVIRVSPDSIRLLSSLKGEGFGTRRQTCLHAGRRPWEEDGGDRGEVSTSQGTVVASEPPETGREAQHRGTALT